MLRRPAACYAVTHDRNPGTLAPARLTDILGTQPQILPVRTRGVDAPQSTAANHAKAEAGLRLRRPPWTSAREPAFVNPLVMHRRQHPALLSPERRSQSFALR